MSSFVWSSGGQASPIEVATEPPKRVNGSGRARTGRQYDGYGGFGGGRGRWGDGGYVRNRDAACVEVPDGTPATYRTMDLDPVLVLSRAVVTAPIREAGISYEAREGTSDLRVRFVQEAIDPLWPAFVAEALDALSMGWKPFEAVWGMRNRQKVVIDLKPLAQETTQALAYPGVPEYGLRAPGADSGTVDLGPPYALLVTIGGHNRNPYGRSWHDAARRPWADKQRCLRDLAKLGAKASGRQAKGYYPPADDEATSHANQNRMLELLGAYMRGDGVAIPNFLGGELSADALADIRNVKGRAEQGLWSIILEDFGDTGAQVSGLLAELAYHNKELSRAWHVPERASQEAEKSGSRADSDTHKDIPLKVAQLVFNGICDTTNRGPINRMLAERYGDGAKDSVKVVAGQVRDVYAEGDWKVIDTLLQNADGLVALAEAGLDLDAVITRRKLPKTKAVLDVGKALAEGSGERARRAAAELAETQAAAADEALGMARDAGEEPPADLAPPPGGPTQQNAVGDNAAADEGAAQAA